MLFVGQKVVFYDKYDVLKTNIIFSFTNFWRIFPKKRISYSFSAGTIYILYFSDLKFEKSSDLGPFSIKSPEAVKKSQRWAENPITGNTTCDSPRPLPATVTPLNDQQRSRGQSMRSPLSLLIGENSSSIISSIFLPFTHLSACWIVIPFLLSTFTASFRHLVRGLHLPLWSNLHLRLKYNRVYKSIFTVTTMIN